MEGELPGILEIRRERLLHQRLDLVALLLKRDLGAGIATKPPSQDEVLEEQIQRAVLTQDMVDVRNVRDAVIIDPATPERLSSPEGLDHVIERELVDDCVGLELHRANEIDVL